MLFKRSKYTQFNVTQKFNQDWQAYMTCTPTDMLNFSKKKAVKNYILLAITLAIKKYIMKKLEFSTSINKLKCKKIANIKKIFLLVILI